MEEMATNYEKDRSGYKFSNTGEVRLIEARHAIQLAKDNLLDLSTVSFDFKSNEMKINEQLRKNDMYGESTFSKIVNNLRRDKNNAYQIIQNYIFLKTLRNIKD